ncbi:MAG: hypothetical protein ABEH43_09440 [Flavobacteriales bacterium]
MSVKKRDPAKISKLTILTMGFYSSFWLLKTGLEFFNEGIISFPSSIGWKDLFRYQLIFWPISVATVPVNIYWFFYKSSLTLQGIFWSILVVLASAMAWGIFLYPWIKIRKAIHNFIDKDLTLWREMKMSVLNLEPIYCFWQREINKKIQRKEDV